MLNLFLPYLNIKKLKINLQLIGQLKIVEVESKRVDPLVILSIQNKRFSQSTVAAEKQKGKSQSFGGGRSSHRKMYFNKQSEAEVRQG